MLSSTKKRQAIFLGHGSPMNALADNEFTQALSAWSASRPKPRAIVSISAHWMTQGTFVSCQPRPKQIYDFYGFPDELYQVSYPCHGEPELADKIAKALPEFCQRWEKQHTRWGLADSGCSQAWGIDHGTWSVLQHLYPAADIPVVQLSIDMSKPPEYHYHLGQALQDFREDGILFLGSGNLVHNLSMISWEENAPVAAWAHEMDDILKVLLLANEHSALVDYPHQGLHARRGIPTQDHYVPMLYILGLKNKNENVKFIYEGIQNASISMRCFELA